MNNRKPELIELMDKLKAGFKSAIDNQCRKEKNKFRLYVFDEIQSEVNRHLDLCITILNDESELRSCREIADRKENSESAFCRQMILDNLLEVEKCLTKYSREVPIQISVPTGVNNLFWQIRKSVLLTWDRDAKQQMPEKRVKQTTSLFDTHPTLQGYQSLAGPEDQNMVKQSNKSNNSGCTCCGIF